MKKQAIIIFFLLFVCAANVLSQNKIKYNVYLRSDAATDTMWDGRVIRIYGMASRLSESPHIPAKVLYCNEGDTVVLNALSISQGDFHTIHLHGLDVNTRNDGDPATSFSLSHNQDTTYTFYAAHAGTYLYHCHVADVVHVQMGMYGLVVVKAAGGASTAWTNGPHFDRSYNWILSEIDPAWHDNIPPHDHAADTVHIPPYVPKYFLINGKSETQLPNDDSTIVLGSAGETIYLRIGAIGFFTNRVIFPKWMKARKIDSDGRPLPESIDNDTVEVAPGERYGVLLTADRIAQDNIAVEFVNMNTDSVWSTQHIPVIIQDASVVEKQSLDPSLIVYPNPATDIAKISITGSEGELAHAELFDLLGKSVLNISGILPLKIDLHSLRSGIYMANVITKQNAQHATITVLH